MEEFKLFLPTVGEKQAIADLCSSQGTRVWTEKYKAIDSGTIGKKLRDNVKAIADQSSERRFTIAHAGLLCSLFDLPVTTFFRIVEAPDCVPTGAWERLCWKGLTAQKVIESGQQLLELVEVENILFVGV